MHASAVEGSSCAAAMKAADSLQTLSSDTHEKMDASRGLGAYILRIAPWVGYSVVSITTLLPKYGHQASIVRLCRQATPLQNVSILPLLATQEVWVISYDLCCE